MSKIIIISGDLAAGKSALAKRLSRHYEIPYFQKISAKKKFLAKRLSLKELTKIKGFRAGPWIFLSTLPHALPKSKEV